MMFKKVLVANRGEIACRIIKTLQSMGIHAVAIYSDADSEALHVRAADTALELGGLTAADSYLRMEHIVNFAVFERADAIHPGYGFLSENAEFARLCERSGVAFIGPSYEHIEDFGLKHKARALAETANIPCTIGTGLLGSADEAASAAGLIGYPIMLKNTGGGGGIGLSVCHGSDEIISSFEAVQRIGAIQFNNAGIFLEQYIASGRHIEVQIFGDGRGNIAILGDRDCSIQRRNQKIIEECPAPNLPENTRAEMHACARRLGESVKYKSAGTVEFIYDFMKDKFYFLEVNTRIQVEHTVTEACIGLDIVECMIKMASDDNFDISFMNKQVEGVALEVRVNAEDPIHGFKPCPGPLKEVIFPVGEGIRIDTGVETGSEVSVFYDSMIAKVIVKAPTRAAAITSMIDALNQTSILGITTNIDYGKQIISSSAFQDLQLSTKFLDTFHYAPSVLEVIEGGGYTTVQDYPGRIKYWAVGVPPSGPMDDLSFRLANRLVHNEASMAAIECTMVGPTLLFHQDSIVAITGGKVESQLTDGTLIPMFTPVVIKAGQTLKIGKILSGVRTYIALQGGINTPVYLGSRSTFVLGKFGGVHGDGATLKAGDLIPVANKTGISSLSFENLAPLSPAFIEKFSFPSRVEIGVLYGPHGAPDFLTEASMRDFFATDYEVHYNSSRLGVRLIGPKPTWARENGGEAGLHPSNVHDCEYAIGSINFTGDSPVILTCDGPSLGGFVCPVVIAKAELWKVGQVRPGDFIRFVCIDFDTAIAIENGVDKSIETFEAMINKNFLSNGTFDGKTCMLAELPATELRPAVYYRQAGDSNILLEYGKMELNLGLRVRVYSLMKALEDRGVDGIIELSPGVRSLQLQFDHKVLHPKKLIDLCMALEASLPDSRTVNVPSRIIRLPMAFEDSDTLDAVNRYRQTVRATAPWLPNNVDFIQRINGLGSREQVSAAIFDASYLVLGLGDVYLGAPCAVPLDPRHRLVTSKYNPARTFTAEGTVGIGGVYMCIYGMDSPGGYQLVGKTLPIWSRDRSETEPWLVKIFDQVSFYPVPERDLTLMRKLKDKSRVIRVEASVFNLATYEEFLETNQESIQSFQAAQKVAFDEEVKLWGSGANDAGEDVDVSVLKGEFDDCIPIVAQSYGCVWKILCAVGERITEGSDIVILEAMKMETKITCHVDGVIAAISCVSGKMVKTGETLILIRPVQKGSNEWILKYDPPLVGEISGGPLFGLTFAAKDNIDVQDSPTTAACPQFSYMAPSHATVVKRLLDSGAALVGKTNLDQFACGLNGTRSPYGAVPNAFNKDYVSGGSSSGSSYAVATGQVDFSLGTDTAGSGRVPAGLQNIVGLKPSKGLISTKGVLPAAASADCVSIFSRTVETGWRALMEARGYDSECPFSRELDLNMTTIEKNGVFTFGVPDKLSFFGDELSESCFDEAIAALEAMGGKKIIINYAPLAEIASMLYEDAFVAERYSGIRAFFDSNESDIMEPVRSIIKKGKNYSAADLYDAQLKLLSVCNDLKRTMWSKIDLLVVPTAPTHYKITDMLADPLVLNRNLGAYTNFVNLLDYAAVSVPSAIRTDGLPFGITLIGTCGSDYQLCELGQRYHHTRHLPEAALGTPLPEPSLLLRSLAKPITMQLAVVGAHLAGMPLHHQLQSRHAVLVKKCNTAAVYRLYAIANSTPPKPALVYVGSEYGVSIEIEIYELAFSAVGTFLTEIPAPLGLGTLEVDDGTTVKGFIAEPRAMKDAIDISSYGAWRTYIKSLSS